MMTLAGAMKAIERGEVSAAKLTREVLDRIDALNDRMRVFITVMREEAERAPGIPVSVKDLYDTKGVRTTAGAKVFADRVPNEDAVAVRKLKEAGAAIV